MARAAAKSLFTADLILPAIGDAFRKLNPRELVRNPVMFVTACVALLLTVLINSGGDTLALGFKAQLVVWLWLTVLFGTFAEALAEGRGKAQAASLRATKAELTARRLKGEREESVAASQLRSGDVVIVSTGELIPADGEVIMGVASVNEAAITGESAPVIREAGGDRSAVTAGTRVVSDELRIRVTADPGQGLSRPHDRAGRGCRAAEDPNEIALTILLVGLTIIFLIAVGTIPAFASYAGGKIPVVVLAALLITLIPTTIAALLSAIGIAGMDRLVRFRPMSSLNPAARSRPPATSMCCCSIKRGRLRYGNRQAVASSVPLSGTTPKRAGRGRVYASHRWPTTHQKAKVRSSPWRARSSAIQFAGRACQWRRRGHPLQRGNPRFRAFN